MNKYVFYNYEFTEILDFLLKYIPENKPFNLFELSQKHKPIIRSEFDFLFESKEMYSYISNLLITDNFVKKIDENLIKLTNKGLTLKNDGSWSKYQKRLKLQNSASYQKLYRDANWLSLTILGFIITTIVSVTLSLILEKPIKSKNTIELKIHLDSLQNHNVDTLTVDIPHL